MTPMPFSQTAIADVRIVLDGAEFYVSWTSSAPLGTVFQVYVDRRLTWFGKTRFCHAPIPAGSSRRNVWIEVGTVDSAEQTTDFSASLTGPGGTGDRAQLTWIGGSYLDPTGKNDIEGFTIYQSDVPSGAVDFTKVVGAVVAYPGGVLLDGFGLGGFGQGGFGRAATTYQWRSEPLSSGAWTFAVVPYDHAGNAQAHPTTTTVTIATAPLPPAPDASGKRLNYTYAALRVESRRSPGRPALNLDLRTSDYMATTYTANARLQKPATADRNWDVTLNANADTLDAVSAIGGLATTVTETPSATLNVRVAAGSFVAADGTLGAFRARIRSRYQR